MNFTNYTDFRSGVMRLIDGDDVASGSIATDTLDLLIALGENRVYLGDEGVPGLRTRDMETSLSVVLASNAAAIPSDCLELKRVQFSGELPCEYLQEDTLLRYLDAGGSGAARFYTQQGPNLIFYPSTTGTVGGRYFKRPADLKTGGLHPTFNRYPEAFLYAALAESAPFVGEDTRLPIWKQMWASAMKSANLTERNLSTSGGRLTVRAR